MVNSEIYRGFTSDVKSGQFIDDQINKDPNKIFKLYVNIKTFV